jgi:hypothetical protein
MVEMVLLPPVAVGEVAAGQVLPVLMGEELLFIFPETEETE